MENKIANYLIPIIDKGGIIGKPLIDRIILDKNDCLGLSVHGIYEPLITELIKANVKERDIVCDLGAHIGYYTIIFSALVGEKGLVYAFEPESANYEILNANIELNRLKNVIAEKSAVSNYTGEATLYKSSDNSGDHRLNYSCNDRKSEDVNVVELDKILRKTQRFPNFLKIDTQGSEFHILVSLLRIVNNIKSIKIICEFSPYLLSGSGIEGIEFLDLLRDNGFQIFHIDDIKNRVYLADIEFLLDTFPSDIDVGTNLFCIRNIE